MKLLLDQNLPVALTQALRDVFPVIDHVRQLGMERSGDGEIWLFAAENGYAIVTKDSDFYYRSQVSKSSPKVVGCGLGIAPPMNLKACSGAVEQTFLISSSGQRRRA